jgi:predicted Zn-dependent peptidase
MENMGANTGNISVTAVDANQAVSVMLNEIDDLKKELVSDKEITETSGQFLTTYFLKQQTNSAQAVDLAATS